MPEVDPDPYWTSYAGQIRVRVQFPDPIPGQKSHPHFGLLQPRILADEDILGMKAEMFVGFMFGKSHSVQV